MKCKGMIGMKKDLSKLLGSKLAMEHELWNHLYQNGGSDPNWEDGVNLNLVRNHIISYRRQCQEELRTVEYPEEYYVSVPPKIDNHYMARADEIREHAKNTLEIYMSNLDYQYLQNNLQMLNEKQRKETFINAVVGYFSELEKYIAEDCLVGMRRHEYPERYIDSFQTCRKKVETILGTESVLPIGQLSIFDLFDV